MARIRTIKPEIWESQQLGATSILARLTFIGLVSLADDTGRGPADVRFLIGRLHPYASDINVDNTSAAMIELAQQPLKGKPLVVFYEHDGKRYYYLPSFLRHQKIDHPSAPKWPEPPAYEPSNVVEQAMPPIAGKPKTNQQAIIEAFATNRGVDLRNFAIRDRFFSANGAAAVELDRLCSGNLEMAVQSITDIARYLDSKVQDGNISEWRHLGAVNNNYVEWRKLYDKMIAKRSEAENGARS